MCVLDEQAHSVGVSSCAVAQCNLYLHCGEGITIHLYNTRKPEGFNSDPEKKRFCYVSIRLIICGAGIY